MTIENLLSAFLSGGQQPAASSSSAGAEPPAAGEPMPGNPTADLIGSLLGGSGQGGGDLGSLLQAILGGAAGQPSGLGGGMPDSGVGGQQPDYTGGTSQTGGGGLIDILGAILGGGALGGGGMNAGMNSALAPITNALANKVGIPPVLAQMIVMFVLSKLLSAHQSGGTLPAPAPAPSPRKPPRQGQQAQPQGLNLDSLLQQLTSRGGVSEGYLRSTGLPQELSQQAGISPDLASQSLQELFGLLGSGMGGGQESTPTPPTQ